MSKRSGGKEEKGIPMGARFLIRFWLVLALAALVPACNKSSSGGVIVGPPSESEPNDTAGTANSLGPAGATYVINGKIDAPGDDDYFSVGALAGTVITVDLTNLPANYDLHLYDAGGLLEVSINAGTADEKIVHTALTAQVYTVHVFGTAGAFDADQSYLVTVSVRQGGELDPTFGAGGIVQVNPDPGPFDTFNDGVIDLANGVMYIVGGVGDGTGTNSLWRMEKRLLSDGSLVAGFGTGGVVLSDPNPVTTSVEEATAVAIDVANDRMYVVGTEVSVAPNTNWRFEKRVLSTGALDPTFGNNGVWGSAPSTNDDQPTALAIDGTWMYIVGYDEQLGAGNRQWRIEKRALTDAGTDAAFGTAGVLLSSASGDEGGPEDLRIDAGGDRMYVVGTSTTLGGDLQWQIENRSLSTGTGTVGFGTAGVLAVDHSGGDDDLRSVFVDVAGGVMYLVGDDSTGGGFDRQWRTEKRQLADGVLVGAFGTGGAILYDPGTGFDFGLMAFLDGTALYVSGLTHVNPPFPGENFQIEIEKRDSTTGALIDSFGTGGLVTEDPTLYADGLGVLGADATHIYLAGLEGLGFATTQNAGWRLEKRTK